MAGRAVGILRRAFSMVVFVFASTLFFSMFGGAGAYHPPFGGTSYFAWAYILSAYALIIVAYVRNAHPLLPGLGAFLALFFYIATTSNIDLFPFGTMRHYEAQYWLAMLIYSAVVAFLFYVSVAVVRRASTRDTP
jgi:hypothetical protein